MFFGFFPLLIQSTIFGVDIGFEYIKVSVVYPDSTIKSALNQQSKRLSPAYFAFWNKSNPRTFSLNQISNSDSHIDSRTLQQMNWAFFDSAKSHSQRFPQNGFKGLISRILENNFHGLTGREVFALVIRRLISTIDDGKYNPNEASVVISIDPSVSRITRDAIADALKMANIHLISIIDSSTSVATLYAQEKKSFFYGTSKNVLFYDMGSNSSWAGVYKFSMPRNDQNQRVIPIVEELSVVSDENLGGNRMDEILANHLMSKYFKKEKVQYSNKIRQIFITEAKRAKEILTTDKSTTVRIDDIPGCDHGMNYVLTRDEFEDLISEMEGSISTLFTTTFEKANLSPDEIDSIELIGGPTRVPFVSKALIKASGMAKLNRTMNSDEAVSIGAGYVGLSKAIHNSNINFKPLSRINVSLYKDDQFLKQIFSEGSRLDGIVSIQLKAQDLLPSKANEATTLSIVVNNTDRLSSFTFANQIDLLNQFIRSKDDSVTLVFHFNKASVPSLYQTYIGKDLNTKLEPKHYYPVWKMNDNEIDYSSQFVKYMEKIMKERQDLEKIKNDYESLIYQLKNLVQNNETFRNIAAERSIEYLEDQIVKHKSWLENENEYELEDYQEKYNQLKNLLEKALSLRPRNHQRYHQPRQDYSRQQRMFNRRRGLFSFERSPFFM